MSGSQSGYEDLAAALAGDLDGEFERLVLAFQGRLFAFALRLTGDRRDAEEVAQDALVRAYRALQGYDTGRIRALLLRPWLYQITLNVARNRARGLRLRTVPLDAGDEDDNRDVAPALADDARARPDAQVVRAEEGDRLAASLAALPERYRTAVILRHVEGLSYPDLAAVLEQPVGTVKANVHRGIGLLRARLRAEEERHGQPRTVGAR